MSEDKYAEDRGMVRVGESGRGALWLTCDQCGRSNLFLMDHIVVCRCGAEYDHAVTPDGTKVPLKDLTLVADGPLQWQDMEWNPRAPALVGLIVLALILMVWYVFL